MYDYLCTLIQPASRAASDSGAGRCYNGLFRWRQQPRPQGCAAALGHFALNGDGGRGRQGGPAPSMHADCKRCWLWLACNAHTCGVIAFFVLLPLRVQTVQLGGVAPERGRQ